MLLLQQISESLVGERAVFILGIDQLPDSAADPVSFIQSLNEKVTQGKNPIGTLQEFILNGAADGRLMDLKGRRGFSLAEGFQMSDSE